MKSNVATRPITVAELDGASGYSFGWGLLPTAIVLATFTATSVLGLVQNMAYGWGGNVADLIGKYGYAVVFCVIALAFLTITVPAFPAAARLGRTEGARGGLAFILVPLVAVLLGLTRILENKYLADNVLSEPANLLNWRALDMTPEFLVTTAMSALGALALAFSIEVALRGNVMGGLTERGQAPALTIVAVIGFVLIAELVSAVVFQGNQILRQMNNYGYGGGPDWLSPLYYLAGGLFAGAVLALLRWATGSLNACIVAALLSALIGVVGTRIVSAQNRPSFEETTTGPPYDPNAVEVVIEPTTPAADPWADAPAYPAEAYPADPAAAPADPYAIDPYATTTPPATP